MEDKLLEPNQDKKLFTITIDVYRNCSTIGVAGDDDYQPSYQEIIGALEVNKITMVIQQTGYNISKLSKKKRK